MPAREQLDTKMIQRDDNRAEQGPQMPGEQFDSLTGPSRPATSNSWDSPHIADLYQSITENEWYESLNEKLCDLIAPKGSHTTVDLGCGTCSLARHLILKMSSGDGRIIAIDNSEAMLRKAEEISTNIFKSISYFKGDAEKFVKVLKSAEIQKVDHITAANSIHLFNDLNSILMSSMNTLRPGGTFSFSSTYFYNLKKDSGKVMSGKDGNEATLLRLLSKNIKDYFKQNDISPEARRLRQKSKLDSIERSSSGLFLDMDKVQRKLQAAFFRIDAVNDLEVNIPIEDAAKFLQLPDIARSVFPDILNQDIRSEIISKSLSQFAMSSVKRRWVLVKATRFSR